MKIKEIIFLVIISLIFIEKGNTEISDSLFMTIGNKAIARSDIVDEIKIILILNNESYNEDKREKLQKLAINSIIKRMVKKIEIDRNNFFQFNQEDFTNELVRLANNIHVDVETLKNIFASNQLNFSNIENSVKVDLMWNSLIFQLYKNKISIDIDQIDEQLKLDQVKKKIEEYLISEILIRPVEENKVESTIKELKNKIKIEGFENVAKSLGISESASNGGDLGWLNENKISKKVRSVIANTSVGELSIPILLPEGILLFKVRDKRKINSNLSLEARKNQLVNSEKIKILNMHSLSHYDKVRRSIAINYLE